MKARELYEKVGRDMQHIEDLVYIDGPEGALYAVDRLRRLAKKPDTLTLKWDGTPAVVFGRDADGQFHFGDKYARETLATQKAIKTYYLKKVKGEADNRRMDFINKMVRLHSLFEKATPTDFRGYIKADLLWWDTPEPNEDGELVFAPNTVRYFVDASTELGQRATASQVGAAAVGFQEDLATQSQPVGKMWKFVGSTAVVILGPVISVSAPQIDTRNLDKIESIIDGGRDKISEFIEPEPGLSDIRAIIYNFVNQQAAAGDTRRLSEKFASWIESHQKLSGKKKERVLSRVETNPKGMTFVFGVVELLAVAKRDIIQQLEEPTLGSIGIRAELVSGAGGGEGFVDAPEGEPPLKFVDRETFSHANFAKGGS